ncbi:MAG TPA: M1 family aminopeptidase [Edaphocola sp.]|nr:M1 family aminopeptidase [Edaphocola sp.]
MFGAIFSFELKQGFKRPMFYIFFGIYLLLSMAIGFAATGVFGTTEGDSLTTLNSAPAIANILVGLNGNILGMLNSIVLVSIMASTIQKDYQYNSHALFFTKPISKFDYFFGRFTAGLLLGILVMSGMIIGYAIGLMPGIGTHLVGPFNLVNFLQPFLIFTLLNTFVLGVIFFSLTTFTRSTMAAYMACIIMLVGRFIAENLSNNMDYDYIAALIEPFGSNAYIYLTKYWTAAERNIELIPFEGALLYNRILWFGIALAVMVVSYVRFSFSQFLTPFSWFKKKESAEETIQYEEKPLSQILTAQQNYSTTFNWKQLIYLSFFEFKKVIGSTFYIISAALSLVMIGVIYYYSGKVYDTEYYPLTENMVGIVGVYGLLANIFIIFYTGTVMFRERESKIDELVHATPVSNIVLYFSKFSSLLAAVILLQIIAMLTGIGIQFAQGFFDIQIHVYIIGILIFGILSYIATIGICLVMQVFAPNKYLGFFFSLIPLMLLGIVFGLLEWDNDLYNFGSNGPRMPYTQLNGYGPLTPTMVYHFYWIAFVMFLSFVALFFYARGKEKGIKARYLFSKKEMGSSSRVAMYLSLIVFLGLGTYIFYNTNILNPYISSKDQVKSMVDYEKLYGKYTNTLQPRIIESNVNVDIFPDKGSLYVKGYYWLKNKHSQAVDTVFINFFDNKSDFHYKTLSLASATKELINDPKNGVKIVLLQTALQPGDSIKFNFEFDYTPKGFSDGGLSMMVVKNGTFFNNSIMPAIGYNTNAELGSNAERKKHGLPYKSRMHSIDDTAAYANTYISNDADWIRFETVVSTQKGQTAIAPGYLIKNWQENGRNYFHYKMDNPILNFYAFQSANYKIKREQYKGINLELYYDKAHEFNVDDMMLSMKRSLDYYGTNFSPYQFRQLRIIEFPAFASFAQSFANTIPFSENVGFTNKVDTADHSKIDMPFYITAHEVAHQWWAHQIIGADVQGATLLSETMAQYGALMVMEHRYGKNNMRKFLKHEMDQYLQGRAFDSKGEQPLMYVENQQYIHYQKGSVIMYALKDYIGEDALNGALQQFIKAYAFQNPPYVTSKQFVPYLKAATPDSLKYIIKDFFETITIYENYVDSLGFTKLSNGKYKVNLTVGSVKFLVDSMGNNKKIPVNDYIDIGIFGKVKDKKSDYHPLILQKMKIDGNKKRFEFIVDEEPQFAGIDPYNKLIDRTPDNNISNFGVKPKTPNISEQEDKFIIKPNAEEE